MNMLLDSSIVMSSFQCCVLYKILKMMFVAIENYGKPDMNSLSCLMHREMKRIRH